jgi:hypothetical protein
LGSGGQGYASGIALDSSGNVYICGDTTATWGSPTRAFTTGTDENAGSDNAFAAKLTSNGSLIWNTFLGGGSLSFGSGIAIDNSGGHVYVAGSTGAEWAMDYDYSADATWGSPVRAYTPTPYMQTWSWDTFAARVDSSGALTWNTFLGGPAIGNSNDDGNAIVVDSSGNVYAVGTSRATWGSPVQPFTSGSGFAAKLNSSSGDLTWNTFPGGSDAHGIALDSSGNIYITGTSYATWGTPVLAFTTGSDAYVAKLDYHTPPTAAVTYSPTGPVKAGTSLTITATFSSAMGDNPVTQIAISGNNTLTATAMTKTDSTHYTYTYTAGTGDGTDTVALSTGTDLAGNVVTSAPTSGTNFTVDNTPPTSENNVFHSNINKNGGVAVTITSSGDATNSVWFAPPNTHTFIANGNMTAAGGTATTILTPATDGVYKLYVIDAAGNYSIASTATLTVDNIPPSISISAPSVSYVKSGQQVTYTITYYDLNFYMCSLAVGNITLNTTGTAAGSKAVTGSGNSSTGTTRTVTISNITGNGTIGISIAMGTAADIANNRAPAVGPSATFTVDNIAPTNQDTVFASSASVTHGTPVTIVSSASSGGAATDSVWFAPSGTSSFKAGPTMTTADGTATSIQAPATPDTYNLFIIDAAGNVSAASTATLTVQ